MMYVDELDVMNVYDDDTCVVSDDMVNVVHVFAATCFIHVFLNLKYVVYVML